MAFFDAQPFDTSDSTGFVITTPSIRLSDPWDASTGAWTEIEGSTSEDFGGLHLTFISVPQGLIQVAVGAASSEVIIATFPTQTYLNMNVFNHFIPIAVASGSRISVRVSAESTGTIEGQVIGIPSSNFDADPTFSVIECGPFSLADSTTYGEAVTVDASTTVNTKGSWTEISNGDTNNVIQGDSLAQSYDHLGMLFTDLVNPAQTTQTRLYDVAYGAASSEVLIAKDFMDVVMNTERGILGSAPFWVPWGRAAGDRLSARLQSTTNNASDRKGGVYILGIR